MRKVFSGGLLVGLVLPALLVACDGGGAGGKREVAPVISEKPSPPPPPPAPKAGPFDSSKNNVGENFTGHDCRKVASAIREKNTQKDQYETTKEYNSRIAKIKESVLYDDVNFGSQLAFVDNSKVFAKYDADKGVLNFDAPFIGYNINNVESHPMLTAFKQVRNERGYLGKNAFGATADVKYFEEDVCLVTMANLPFEGLEKRKFSLKIAPEKAKKISENIGSAYVGVLMPPYIKGYQEYQKPEISKPREVITKGDDIRFRLQQLIVFDRETGEVLGKKVFK